MSEQKRLFFGISLPEESRQSVIQWRAATFSEEAGRPVAADNLHLTLAFLGEISEEKTQALKQLAGRIQQRAFTLTLDDAGHWPRSGVVWLGPKQSPRGLNWQSCYARRPPGVAAIKVLCPFIRMSHYCVTLRSRSRYRPGISAGSFVLSALRCFSPFTAGAERDISSLQTGNFYRKYHEVYACTASGDVDKAL